MLAFFGWFFVFCLLNGGYCWPQFHLFKSQNTQFNNVNPYDLTKLNFNYDYQTVFIVHGFLGSSKTPWMPKLKDTLLSYKTNLNVFLVDWEQGAAASINFYVGAVTNAKTAGQSLSKFIRRAKIDPKTVHCIGFSLGAHVCGFAGKVDKLGRISGLDPAGPVLDVSTPDGRLDKNDAYFVDVVHTDTVHFGTTLDIGHQDFYVNGGKIQPGCDEVIPNNLKEVGQNFLGEEYKGLFNLFNNAVENGCSHMKAPDFYIESIMMGLNSKKYQATLCTSYKKYLDGDCNEYYSYMGFFANRNKTKHGKFFLNVELNPDFPHLKEEL